MAEAILRQLLARGTAPHVVKAMPVHYSDRQPTLRIVRQLSELRAPAFAGLRKIPILCMLFGGADPWWPVSSAEQITRHSMERVLELFVRHGLPWLERQ